MKTKPLLAFSLYVAGAVGLLFTTPGSASIGRLHYFAGECNGRQF